ncbi:hypothetical protein A3C39_03105 [Candidatus Saccharibacteria bacterium RIFCSPHIGHO2_02_FULL_46_12]|nr:MAG: hypothetical protein A3C39_03105 [Candidatus Saccharibacteria bacterium RIFCSPHIGHO2_02_FULL_46_12]OGL32744.1 MAG: hypothetical protein A3E76_05355 [Candidatus Saccharibacteria bacterium RIFCSPHIGHO2_12_FULL_44_22]
MKQLITKIAQKLSPRSISVIVLSLLAMAIIPASVLAWGPQRATFTQEVPASYVTFNSITNNPKQGDERNFMQVRAQDARNETYSDDISLTPGKEYVIFMFYHNNAASNLNESGKGIAQNAYARAEVPAIVKNGGAGTKAAGYVGASNANPTSVYDDITFKNTTGTDIALRYVSGSTTIHNGGNANGQIMPDTMLSGGGVKLGHDSLNGTLPGCNDYAGFVTFRVKADQPNFTFKKEVKVTGTTGWNKSVSAKKGDKVDYLLQYANTGTTEQKSVVMKDVLPKGLTYVNGSSKLTNAKNPSGAKIGDEIGAAGMNIGGYTAGSNAYLQFTATVDTDECTTLNNTAAVETINGNLTDTASVVVNNGGCQATECAPGIPTGDARCTPAALPVTGPAEVIAGLIGIAAITIGIVYYYKSRRDLQEALHAAQSHPTHTKIDESNDIDDLK